MTDVLADQDARDRIARVHDQTLFVEAGAGSGKTSSLVSRVVNLVIAGADVTSIAAITFTEAAAAELRARVRQTLEDVEGGRATLHVVDTPAARERARMALEQLDRATVCTLHAFAQRLLLGAPVQAGLPPRIEVHDDISSALRFEDRWSRFERSLLDDPSMAVLMRTALSLGVGSDQLQRVAATLGQNWDLVEESEHTGLLAADRAVDVDPTDLPADEWIAEWAWLADQSSECLADDDALLAWIENEAVPTLGWLERNRHDPYVLLTIRGRKFSSPNKGRQANWPDGFKKNYVERAKASIERFTDDVARVTDRVLTRLGAEIAQYTLDDAAARRSEGRLEFHDLLVLARQVLRTHQSVRTKYHRAFDHLLIDEFQDTDPLQVELAVRIAADPAHDTEIPWDEVDVAPGRLFFVGDPKQSIYRFRRADIDLFSRTAERYAAGHTSLNVNFRTTAPVLEFCNSVFDGLITEADDDAVDGRKRIAQPPYVPLETSRPAIPDDVGPPVVVLGDGIPHASAADARDAEAADVAAILRRAHDDAWSVDPGSGPRACRWSDMAILLPSRTSLSHLRTRLDDDGIPYRLESGTLVFGTTEITDLLSILRAIDDPGDAVSIVGALRSPAYGCGDDDLLRWVRDHGRCSYLSRAVRTEDELIDADTPPGVVEAALADLRARNRSAPFQSVPEIVESVIRDRRLMELSLAGGRHRDVWRLYRVVVEHARQFADTEPGGLRSFLHWAALQRDDKVRATSPVIPEADVDAVRILTIHGSKGLEFGITAVSGLSSQDPNMATGATVQFRPSGGFDVRVKKGMETTRFESVRTLEETMDLHERIRLLYVALTRARDHLVVSAHHTERARKASHGGRLTERLDVLEAEVEAGLAERWTSVHTAHDPAARDDPGDGPTPTLAPVVPAPDAGAVASFSNALDEWRAARLAMAAAGATGGVVSATAVARALAASPGGDSGRNDPARDDPDRGSEADAAPSLDPVEPEREPWRRGRAGTSIGSAVHAVLQHADLRDRTGADLPGLATWQAGVEGIADSADLIEHKARVAVASPLVRRAVDSGRLRREVHVAAPIAGIVGTADLTVDLFEGFVDLLFEDEAGLVVVDYKTDDVPSDDAVAAALERYAPQGAAYAVAVEAATGRSVTEVHFLFLRGTEAVDVEVPDLDTAKAQVRAALRSYGGGS